jgi:hypothetical protein
MDFILPQNQKMLKGKIGTIRTMFNFANPYRISILIIYAITFLNLLLSPSITHSKEYALLFVTTNSVVLTTYTTVSVFFTNFYQYCSSFNHRLPNYHLFLLAN